MATGDDLVMTKPARRACSRGRVLRNKMRKAKRAQPTDRSNNNRRISYTPQQTSNFGEIHQFIKEETLKAPLDFKTKLLIKESISLIDPEIPTHVLEEITETPCKDLDTFLTIVARRHRSITKTPAPKGKRTDIHEINDLYQLWKKGIYVPFSMRMRLKADTKVLKTYQLTTDRKLVKEYMKVVKENENDITKSPFVQNPVLVPELKEMEQKMTGQGTQKEKPKTPIKPKKKSKKKTGHVDSGTSRVYTMHPPGKHMLNFTQWRPPRVKPPIEPRYCTLTKQQTWDFHRTLKEQAAKSKDTFYQELKEYVVKYNKNFEPLNIGEIQPKDRRKKFQDLVNLYSPSDPNKYHVITHTLHEDELMYNESKPPTRRIPSYIFRT